MHDATGVAIAVNDNWRGIQAVEIQGTGLAPVDEREAAVIATLPRGNYTAVLRGVNGSAGTGLIEVYDLDSATASRLLNLSTRAYVGTGDEGLIGGFIVRSVSARLLLRAIGPDLAARGIEGALQNPKLELHDSSGSLISSNDDWRDAPNSAEILATGLAPGHDRESAILVTAPGANSYTAIVRGVGNTTGVALLEAYLVP